MKISLLKPSDTKEFVEFYKELTAQSDHMMFSDEETKKLAKKEEEFIKKYDDFKQVFIARSDDKIVGYLGIGRSHLEKLTHIGKFTVGVLDEYKRQKIATELIETAEKWAKDKGVKRLELTVVTSNEPAVELFKKVGFEEEGIRRKSVKIGTKYVDEFMMSKML